MSVRVKNGHNAVCCQALVGRPEAIYWKELLPTIGHVSAITTQGNGAFHFLMRLVGFLVPFPDRREEDIRGGVRFGGSTDGRVDLFSPAKIVVT